MRKLVWKLLNMMHLGGAVQLMLYSDLRANGWFLSFRTKKSVNKDGQPIPWITYPCMHFLSERLKNSFEVLEYGSGNSTHWFSKQVKSVVSVEHNQSWFETCLRNKPANTEIYYIADDSENKYAQFPVSLGKRYDIIFIDGIQRNECIQNALLLLKEESVIVLDNSEQGDYQKGKKLLQESNFRRIDFIGLTPIIPHTNHTTIFYRSNNCLDI